MQKKKPLVLPIARLSVNNLIGEDDVYDSSGQLYGFYRTTVTCTSQKGELLMLSLDDFKRVEDFKVKGESGKQVAFKPYLMAEIKRKQTIYRRAIRARLNWQKEATTDFTHSQKGRSTAADKLSRAEFSSAAAKSN